MDKIIDFIYMAIIFWSVVMAIVYRKDIAGRKLTILIPFLILTIVQETLLEINDYLEWWKSTAVIYSIYRPISAIVFTYVFLNVPFMASLKKWLIGLLAIYLLLVFSTYIFIKPMTLNNGYLSIARGFEITLCAILFLFRYFNLDNSKEERYWSPLIWITAGIGVFYPVITASLAFQVYMAESAPKFKLYQFLPQLMSIFMYGFFCYAFYLCRKIK